MGFYCNQVLPRFQNRAMNIPALGPVRTRACEGLHGEVLEIGFGTGPNVPYFPPGIDRVLTVEPSAKCVELAAGRIAASSIPITPAGLDAQVLELESERFDAVLSTWTMCTIPDFRAALAEVHRVLKPGGAFHFVEHGHSPDARVARMQRRMEPIHQRIFGGCHLTRRPDEEITAAGFEIVTLENSYLKASPKSLGYLYAGMARK